MSTENEGNAVPAAPSVPPVPGAAPEGSTSPDTGPGPHDVAHRTPESPSPFAPAHPESSPHGPAAGAPEHAGHPSPSEPTTAPIPVHDGSTGPSAPAGAPHAGAGWPPPPPALPSYGGGGGGGPVWGAPASEPAPRRKRSGGLAAAVLVAALVAGGVGGGVGYWAAERSDSATSSTTVSAATPQDLKRAPGTVAAVAANALPSVVTIEAKSGGGIEGSEGESEGGTGTGFVYDKEGHILTNNHVVASAAEGGTVSAIFSDGKKYDAEVVGRAQGYDVAVLKLENAPSGLDPLALGDSEKVAVGDSTIAIGAPFGLSNTVTTGIISAKNRPVASGDGSSGKNSYMSALQTDASINPGNSGGPLLDSRGAVIGINSAIQSAGSGGFGQTQAGSIGLGFAIPINQAKTVAEQLIKTGQPVYPVIGATVDMSEQGSGARITEEGAGGTPAVAPDGPAAKVGLKPGDVITKFNGKPIDSGPTLISEIWTLKPGDKVSLTYERDGKSQTVDVVLGERKGDSS